MINETKLPKNNVKKRLPNFHTKTAPDLRKTDMKLSNYIALKNNFITESIFEQKMTANEIKVLELMIANLKPDDLNMPYMALTQSQILSYLNLSNSGRNYSYVNKLMTQLFKRFLTLPREQHGHLIEEWIHWFDTGFHDKTTHAYVFKINPVMEKYMLDLKNQGHYTLILLENIHKLKSKYAMGLYKILIQAKHQRNQHNVRYQADINKLKNNLFSPKSYTASKFKEKVLLPACLEIQTIFPEFQLHLIPMKISRKIIGYEIFYRI